MRKQTLTLAALGLGLLWGVNGWACEGMGKSTHVGQLVLVDPAHRVFTITDAQTQSPITFKANDTIIDSLKSYSGNVMVNYEEKDSGLTAVGVTF
jgi:hypothetical protein